MKVRVEVYSSLDSFEECGDPIVSYLVEYADPAQRRVLAQQCRNAFEGNQVVVTFQEP